MYKLYYMPGACSLATQVILRELDQKIDLVDKNKVENFTDINPIGAIPVLVDGDQVIREGVAILLHLLDKHENNMLPKSGKERDRALQNMLFSNATMHPAYSRLFFIAANIEDSDVKQKAFDAAASAISDLWAVVEQQLGDKEFLGGDTYSAADILLSVYSSWGAYFPVEIKIGEKAQNMINKVTSLPSFKLSVQAEQETSEVA